MPSQPHFDDWLLPQCSAIYFVLIIMIVLIDRLHFIYFRIEFNKLTILQFSFYLFFFLYINYEYIYLTITNSMRQILLYSVILCVIK